MSHLRGTTGVDFEGVAKIARGRNAGSICNLFGIGRGTFRNCYVVVKGSFCFVFDKKSSPSPNYAIGLQHMRPQVSGAGRVSLTDSTGTVVEYEIVFQHDHDASMFGEQVRQQAGKAQTELARRRLGHESLLNKRRSVLFAEQIALEKEKQQPPKPVSDSEVLDAMAAVIPGQ